MLASDEAGWSQTFPIEDNGDLKWYCCYPDASFYVFYWALCAANSPLKAVRAIPVQQRPPLAGTGQLCPALGLFWLGWMGSCVQKVRSLAHFCHLPEGEINPVYKYLFLLTANLGT